MIPLVMIPGMMCDERIFGPQIEELSPQVPVHIADISRHESITALAADVLRQAPAQFCLAGHSMGGIVAMEVCRQSPNRVAKLALIDTNPFAELEEVKNKRVSQVSEALSGKLVNVIRDEMKPNYLANNVNQDAILNICMDMALSLGPKVFVNQSKALQGRADQQKTLESLSIPVLIMCGSEDKLCPLERHEFMHNIISTSVLEVIEDAGHMPTLEKPQKTSEVLRTWLMN
ncbi:alpha/beta hydrolase [bacterium]|nr:alpha/beta hydrolase [bacterium]